MDEEPTEDAEEEEEPTLVTPSRRGKKVRPVPEVSEDDEEEEAPAPVTPSRRAKKPPPVAASRSTRSKKVEEDFVEADTR